MKGFFQTRNFFYKISKNCPWHRVKTFKPATVLAQPQLIKNDKNILFINVNKLKRPSLNVHQLQIIFFFQKRKHFKFYIFSYIHPFLHEY